MTIGTLLAILLALVLLLRVLNKPVVTVNGKVTYPDNTMVAGVTMTLVDSNGVTVNSATTDATGAYQFKNVPEGDYTIIAHKDVQDGTGAWLAGNAAVIAETSADVTVADLALVKATVQKSNRSKKLRCKSGYVNHRPDIGVCRLRHKSDVARPRRVEGAQRAESEAREPHCRH